MPYLVIVIGHPALAHFFQRPKSSVYYKCLLDTETCLAADNENEQNSSVSHAEKKSN